MIPKTPKDPFGPDVRYYGLFSGEGEIRGFYNNEIYPMQAEGKMNSKIPIGAVEISEDAWRELYSGQPLTRYIDGKVVYVDPPPAPKQEPNPLEVMQGEIRKLTKEVQELKKQRKAMLA